MDKEIKSKDNEDFSDLLVNGSNSLINNNNSNSSRRHNAKREKLYNSILHPTLKLSSSVPSFNGRNIKNNLLKPLAKNSSYHNSNTNSVSSKQDDLLMIVGCSKSSANLLKPKKLLHNNSKSKLFRYGPQNRKVSLKEEGVLVKEEDFYTDEDYYDTSSEKVNIMPFQLAGTIYTELCRQKAKFYNKIKQGSKVSGVYDAALNNDSHSLKNLQQLENVHTTCFLDRKLINEIPVTLPIYLSHNTRYESISQKHRHEKILDLFIKLKTYVLNDPDNDLATIKEFLLKNGIYNKEYYELEKLNNFILYLTHPLNINPKLSLGEVVKEAVTYQPTEQDYINYKDRNFDTPKVYYENNSTSTNNNVTTVKFRREGRVEKNKEKTLDIDEEKYYEQANKQYKQKELNELIQGLEEEFKSIQREKMEKIEKNNNIWNPQVVHDPKEDIIDKNKFIPNLCLSSQVVNSRLMNKVEKNKQQLLNKLNKQKRIKEINQRMYYSSILKDNCVDIEEIKRRKKLTEFIILERAKKQIALENEKKKLALTKDII